MMMTLRRVYTHQGDAVCEVLANGDHVKAISPTLSRDQVESELAKTAKSQSTKNKSSTKERASRTGATFS